MSKTVKGQARNSKRVPIQPKPNSKTVSRQPLPEAKARIKAKGLEEESDAIFSFRLSNKERLIGIRNGVIFKVIWYDANHEFAPSHLKNT